VAHVNVTEEMLIAM